MKRREKDSDAVVITRRQTSQGNSVRIQIGGQATQKQQKPPPPVTSTSDAKRKYTLEELEVEGFEPSSTSSESEADNQGKAKMISEEDDFDLNSLIEGAVDDDEDAGSPDDLVDALKLQHLQRNRRSETVSSTRSRDGSRAVQN